MSDPRIRDQAMDGTAPAPPANGPAGLRFGTSGLRGLVTQMTDLEVYVNTRGFLDYLLRVGDLALGDPIALGRDLRERCPASGLASSPRIAAAVLRAIEDAGLAAVYCGHVPTPALAYYARYGAGTGPMPAIMVTGSHIPPDRNGIKFYRSGGEVLKSDEAGILDCVRAVRAAGVGSPKGDAMFDAAGMLRSPPELPAPRPEADDAYLARYAGLFRTAPPLAGRRVVLFEHSAVGRDLTRRILDALGAEVISIGRTERFVPIDTENLSAADRAQFQELATLHRPFAIVSTDGDGDRPIVADERGAFHSGDALGLIVAEFLGARFAAVPVSATDAIERWAERRARAGEAPPMTVQRTRIGSPYVIEAMNRAVARGRAAVVGWEANGGFLTATDFDVGGRSLKALATRDALLPIVAALVQAVRRDLPVSQLFAGLPQRAVGAGLLDEVPPEASRAIVERFSPRDAAVVEIAFDDGTVTLARRDRGAAKEIEAAEPAAREALALRERLAEYLPAPDYSPIAGINYLDGVRVSFANGDVLHLRPSGNAPQLRAYALSDRQERADRLVAEAVREPDGLLRRMARDLAGG